MYCRSRPSIPLRSRLDFGRCVPWHAHPIGPACPRLHLRSVLQHASGFFPTRPRGARAWASHDGDPCMQLPSARGCYQLAPQRTSTSNPVPMPGTPKRAVLKSSTGFNRAGDGSCRDLALRFVQQEGAPVGCVRHARLPAPIRAVGKYEAQLTVTRLSQSISPFAPLIFTSFIARTKRSDFGMRIGIVVVASFQPTAHADPCRSPRVRTLNVLPLPASIPLRSRLDFGRCVPWHAHPIGPACPRLHLRSVLQHASGFFPTRPPGARAWASHDGDPCMQLPSARGCYQLAPQRTSTSNPVPMPGTPRRPAALASPPATKALDPDPFPRHSLRHAVYAALLHFGFETAKGCVCLQS